MTEETSLLEHRLKKMAAQGVYPASVCAWCQKVLTTITDTKPPLVSHGICAECDRELLENIAEQ